MYEQPIGYIQLYNAYDFSRGTPLVGLPGSLSAFDLFIGEASQLGKGYGSKALELFLKQYSDPTFGAAFADPDDNNTHAIKAYHKAGFQDLYEHPDTKERWMLRFAKP